MPVPYTSRELSERVEIESHRRPNRFRRRTWWGAFWLSVLCLVWLAWEGARGEYHIYEAGEVAIAHRMFENDCAKCHTTWAPVDRFLNLDFSDKVYSVDNAACLACHPGSTHHKNQIPAHDDISCAKCHIEHEGHRDLKRVADRICLECHRQIETTDGRTSFEVAVSEFGRERGPGDNDPGHPEFAFARLLDSNSADTPGIGHKHSVLDVLEFTDENGWQDQANIRFNHAAHLKSERDATGELVYGIIGKDQRLSEQKFSDLSQTCSVCHEENPDGRYMKPIRFENHCQSCHPIYFDNQQFPKEQVPHESPDIVRGFLTERYTMAALRNPDGVPDSRPARSIPGRASRPLLTKNQADWVKAQLESAERDTLRHTHVFFGPEAKGGCAYCHTVENQETPGDWQIVSPNIPDRWMQHAIFSHEAHQMMNCAECHAGVGQSKDTGDAMLPKVELCRKCHSKHPEQPPGQSPSRYFGARNDCVECHVYHDHREDRFTGTLDPLFQPSKANPDAILKNENTN